MKAEDFLTRAESLVSGERNIQHGEKAENLGKIATLWTAWLTIRRDPTGELTASDVAALCTLLKLARTQSGQYNPDDYVDGPGYFAIMGQLDGIGRG
jgi:hypothetical protein